MKKTASKGFTLLELSIVIIIISVLSAMAVSSSLGVLANARQVATDSKMKQIEQALIKYRIANDRLPCPASLTVTPGNSAYGVEVADTGNTTTRCGNANFSALNSAGTAIAVAEGAVPVLTIGLPADFMYDGWGNRLRYAVKVDMTYLGAFSGTPIGALCGGITIMTGPSYPASATISSNAIYALVSHGVNGHGGYTKNGVTVNAASSNSDEQANCHCNSSAAATTYAPTYVQEQPTSQSTSNPLLNFDDVVVFKERWQLQGVGDGMGTACPAVYVSDTSNNRIQNFDLYGNYNAKFGSAGSASGQFNVPKGITYDKFGYVWVVDNANNRVQKLDSNGNFIAGIGAGYNGVSGSIGSTGTGNGQFNDPVAVAVDSAGSLWVAEWTNTRIQKFDRNLNYLFSIPASGTTASSANGSFSGPVGTAVDAQDNLWVVDGNNNRIQQFSSNGIWLQSVGGPSPYTCKTSPAGAVPACAAGSGDGQLQGPKGITIDKAGNVWVSDTSNNRLEKFSATGAFLSKFTIGTGGKNVSADSNSNLWLADTGGNKLQKCTPAGSCTALGSTGTGNGQFSAPYGIYVPNR